MTATRRTDPAIEMDALPPVDFVLLSHVHEDHFERRLDRSLPVVTTPHAATGLTSKGFRAARGLKTWEPLTVTKGRSRVRVTPLPGQHGPGIASNMLPFVMGSLLEFENGRGEIAFRLYVTARRILAAG